MFACGCLWRACFKSGECDVSDKERPGQPKKFKDAELAQLLEEDSCHTQEELAIALCVDRSTIAKPRMIQKQGFWVPYELKPRDVDTQINI